jgi:hypothetical protein
MSERRERMMAGDDAYLLPRDKGPVRALRPRHRGRAPHQRARPLHARGVGLIFIMLAVPQVQYFISPAMLILMAIMIVDGFFWAAR